MGAPTIVSLQEVQDSDGATISSVIDSDVTLKTLTDLIEAQYGIHYAFAYINPPGYNINGGQPNGNIRQAFLYQPDQVTLDGLVQLTDPNPGESDLFAGDDFANSRKPLVGEFSRNGVHFYVINNHFDSKGGDNALFGNAQPPVLSSELQRIEQAKIVHDYVAQLLAADPTAKIVVNGDLNDFSWSNPLQTLEGVPQGSQILFDLGDSLLPVNERYSYNYDGNTQELDHQLASSTLLNGAGAAYDIVHVNSEFATQASDHDPSVARFDFTGFSETLTLTDAAETVDGGAGDDTVLGMGGNDSLAGGSGADSLDGGTGADTLAGGTGSDTYVVDQAGDLVIEQPGEGTDTVRSGVTYTLGADVENLVLTGGRTSGTGNALDNDLAGSGKGNALAGLDGADTLNGGGGDDTLTGGLGADQLTGGKGADLFYYGSAAEGGDTILDFKGGTDAIGVSAAGFGGGLFAGEDLGMTGRFTSNRDGHATASDGTGQFVFATATKALYWDEDGQGTGEAVLIATIGKTLAASDIHVLA
jgi:Ca2+-binding RTX toxin-like protein